MKADEFFWQTLVAVRMVSKSGAPPVAVQMLNGSHVPHAPIITGEGVYNYCFIALVPNVIPPITPAFT